MPHTAAYEDEKIANGAAVRVSLTVVPHNAEDIAALTERTKERTVAQLRARGEEREILFEPDVLVIETGVPRPDVPWNWAPEPAEPQQPYKDRYADERAACPPAQVEPMMPPPPVEWHRFTTVTRNPKNSDPGQIIEALYSVQGGLVAVKDLKNEPIGTAEIHRGDDVLAAARKLVREKRPSGFFDPIPYPYRRPN